MATRAVAVGDAQGHAAMDRHPGGDWGGGAVGAPDGPTRRREGQMLRAAFEAMDRDGDGKLGVEDLRGTYRHLGQRYSRRQVLEQIFEVDDDGDGYIGWEECSNLWVRGKQPFERRGGMEAEPKQFFDLVDFVTLDVKLTRQQREVDPSAPGSPGQISGRVPNTNMLDLFSTRYSTVAINLKRDPLDVSDHSDYNLIALADTEETKVGDAGKGVTFQSYMARAAKIHDALFYANKLAATVREPSTALPRPSIRCAVLTGIALRTILFLLRNS